MCEIGKFAVVRFCWRCNIKYLCG